MRPRAARAARVTTALVGALALAGALLTLAAPATTAGGRPLPSYVDTRPKVQQMVTVTSKRWHTSHATLRAWQRPPGGRWRLVRGPVRARIGYGGFVRGRDRRQGTGRTPAGNYALPRAFGRLADPGTRLHYRRFDRNDFWPYEPRDRATYNIYQGHKARRTHWRRGYRERLWDYRDQYRYAVVVGFNLPQGVHWSKARRQRVARKPANTRRGGGIFVHVNGSGATAGCVSVRLAQMRWLVRWLDPDRTPRIVMGPRRYVRRL